MFGSRDPFFSNVFANDPFFAMANQMMGGFPGMVSPPQQGRGPRAPSVHIEEVPDDGSLGNHGRSTSQPIIEEPDDDPAVRQSQRPRRTSPPRAGIDSWQRSGQQQQQHQQLAGSAFGPLGFGFGGFGGLFQDMHAMANQPGAAAYSFSSSSYSSSGPGGVTYQTTHTQRMGPGGVRESQSTVHDGRTGQQTITVSRGLGAKERTITRTRDASGREQAHDNLNGISAHEADAFDNEWRTRAERSLPNPLGAGGVGVGRLGAGAGRSVPVAAALPAASAGAYGAGSSGYGAATNGYGAGTSGYGAANAGAAGGYGAGASAYPNSASGGYTNAGNTYTGNGSNYGAGVGRDANGAAAASSDYAYPHRAPHHQAAGGGVAPGAASTLHRAGSMGGRGMGYGSSGASGSGRYV